MGGESSQKLIDRCLISRGGVSRKQVSRAFGFKTPCAVVNYIVRHYPDKIAMKVSRLSNNIPNKNTQICECNGMASF